VVNQLINAEHPPVHLVNGTNNEIIRNNFRNNNRTLFSIIMLPLGHPTIPAMFQPQINKCTNQDINATVAICQIQQRLMFYISQLNTRQIIDQNKLIKLDILGTANFVGWT
jgi:hypothetical protein